MTPTTQAGATSADETKTLGQIAYEAFAARIHVPANPQHFSREEDWDRIAAAVLEHAALASPAVVPESVRRLPQAATAWVIANAREGTEQRFRRWGQIGPEWTTDHNAALWFARRSDAEAFAAEDEDAWRILPDLADAPPSGRAAEGGESERLLKRLAAASRSLAEFPPDGLVKGDLYVAAKNEGQGTGWRYLPLGVTVSDLDDAARLVSAPTPPASAGDVERMSRDELEPHINGLADWLVAHGGMGTWAATSSAKALLLRRDSPVRLATAPAAPEPAAGGETYERVRHLKSGREYEVLGEAEAQVSVQCGLALFDANGRDIERGRLLTDYDTLTVYRSIETGKLWCRFTDEFRDGRFEAVATPTRADAEGRRP